MLEEERRFNWIYCFLDATRWGLLNEVTQGNYRQIFSIQDLLSRSVVWWVDQIKNDPDLQRWLKCRQSHGCYFSQTMRSDLHYVYDLEAELWGSNWNLYCDWHSTTQGIFFEPFRMVGLFYLIERQIKLLLSFIRLYDYEQKNTTHGKLRNALYRALFEQMNLSRWFPYPFNIATITRRLSKSESSHAQHEGFDFVGNHFSCVGKNHYTGVLQGALCQSAKRQRKERTDKTGKRPKNGSIEGYFFDTFWHYSESYRYRVPLAGIYPRQNPFYWGLNVRWITTFFVTICEAWMFTLSPAELRACWTDYKQISTSPILQDIQNYRWEALRNSRPQDLL